MHASPLADTPAELPATTELAVIGGGIVGLAVALHLSRQGISLTLLEAEPRLAAHQTGHNSGVVHSGLYYKPGSLKARLCVEGRDALYALCAREGIRHERCGKVVVATEEAELPMLRELERRGAANGLAGVATLTPEQVREREPNVRCVAGLLVPETGIVDYGAVCASIARQTREAGGTIVTGARVTRGSRRGDGVRLETTRGTITARALVNCAGLYSDRVARACGVDTGVRIIPFRGEYYELNPERRSLVKHLIYPVPDPRYPFLGVHFTRRVGGEIEAGPNAVLAFAREGYTRTSVSLLDLGDMLAFPGFWRMSVRHWRTGITESYRSWNKPAFVAALRKLIPELRESDVHPAGSGVRAQAVDANGALLDDFRIEQDERMVHVLNAPSPGATASLAIGRTIAERVLETLGAPLPATP